MAGRFGFSFPLGGSFRSKGTTTASNYQELLQATASTPQQWKQYQIAVATNITQLQSALAERDEEIETLQEELKESERRHKGEIKSLEQKLEESDKEDQRQNALISDLLRDKKQQQQQIAEMQAKLELLLRSRE